MTPSRPIPFLALLAFVGLVALASCTQAPPPPAAGGPLEPGTSVTTGTGAVIGAPPGALESSLAVTAHAVAAPDASALPDGATAVGSAVRLTPARDVTTPTDAPLLVGLPIPAGQDTAHLAAAVLIPADQIDYDVVGPDPSVVPGDTWELLPGQVDAQHGLFVTSLLSLPGAGQTLALVEAPEADAPPIGATGAAAGKGAAGGAARAAAAQAGAQALTFSFTVTCRGFAALGRADECTASDQAAAAQALSDVFHDLLGQGFAYPRLRRNFVTSGLFPPRVSGYEYLAYLRPFHHGTGGSEICRVDPNETSHMTGVYFHVLGKAIVCLGDPEAPQFGSAETLVMRHEYFHATQYAYTSSAPSWFKESTAVASERSLTSFNRSASQSPHHLDVYALSETEKYRLQDFWVYLGKRYQLQLRDLIPFLRAGGGLTDVERVLATDARFGSLGGLGPTYWAWIKDQAVEQSVPMGGSADFLTRCAPHADATGALTLLKHGGPAVVSYDGQTASAPVQLSLHALTAALVRLDLTALPAGDYTVTPTVSTTAPRVRAKFYDLADAGTPACDATPDGTGRSITVSAGHDRQFYVLVANTDTHDAADVTVSIAAAAPAVDIVRPAPGTSVEEATVVTVRAQPSGFGTDLGNVQVTWTYPRYDGVPVTAAVTQGSDSGTIDGLCDGSYTLTATARDPATGRSASADVTLTVTQPSAPPKACAPSVAIADPADGSTVQLGDPVTFRAVIDDDHPETDAPVFPLTWYDGGVGGVPIQSDLTTFTRTDLGLGTHHIAVVYGDASDTIDVTVVDTSNTPPTAAIASPADKAVLVYSSYNAGHPSLMYVPLGGNGFDAQDGTVGLSWFYRKVGAASWTFIGNGRTPTWILAFEQGNVSYEIRLLAVDSGGLQGEDVHTVTVQGPTG